VSIRVGETVGVPLPWSVRDRPAAPSEQTRRGPDFQRPAWASAPSQKAGLQGSAAGVARKGAQRTAQREARSNGRPSELEPADSTLSIPTGRSTGERSYQLRNWKKQAPSLAIWTSMVMVSPIGHYPGRTIP